jgi:hypothetical protein
MEYPQYSSMGGQAVAQNPDTAGFLTRPSIKLFSSIKEAEAKVVQYHLYITTPRGTLSKTWKLLEFTLE